MKAAGEYEEFLDQYFGLYILHTEDVPMTD